MKKVFVIILLSLAILSLSVSSFALSFDGDEFPQMKYTALVPWSEISVTADYCTWRFAPFGSTFYVTNGDHGQVRDPSYAEASMGVVGWTYTDGDEPTLEVLTVEAVQRGYSQPSTYRGGLVEYTFDRARQDVVISFTARNFHVTRSMWNALESSCWCNFPGTALFDIQCSINYYGVDSVSGDLSSKNLYFERQGLVGDTSYRMFPAWSDLSGKGLEPFADGYTIQEITLTFLVDNYQGNFYYGNLYDYSTAQSYTPPVYVKEEVIEKETIIEVPAEELNLYNWLIEPIEQFFLIELFPGITLGGLVGIFVMILVSFGLIKLWGK